MTNLRELVSQTHNDLMFYCCNYFAYLQVILWSACLKLIWNIECLFLLNSFFITKLDVSDFWRAFVLNFNVVAVWSSVATNILLFIFSASFIKGFWISWFTLILAGVFLSDWVLSNKFCSVSYLLHVSMYMTLHPTLCPYFPFSHDIVFLAPICVKFGK